MAQFGRLTNRGKNRLLAYATGIVALPANARFVLCKADVAPSADTNLLSDLAEIDASADYPANGTQKAWGNGVGEAFTGAVLEDDANDRAELTIADLTWTAAGGREIPDTGTGARYLVLCNDAGGVTPGNDEVLGYWDLDPARTTATDGSITFSGFKLRLSEPV